MGSKTRLGSYCTKRDNNGVNLVTSRNINTRLARPIIKMVQIAASSQLDMQVLGQKFGSATRLCKRPSSVWNCLWVHVL